MTHQARTVPFIRKLWDLRKAKGLTVKQEELAEAQIADVHTRIENLTIPTVEKQALLVETTRSLADTEEMVEKLETAEEGG